ncbi:zinc ribbon domain-containing protein [Pasteurellaceae bacterium LIM206]|nr:zinc ribbon domain-containing protein [Pasteurellaceae bacterium LIM206]
MTLQKCPECRRKISESAKLCPHCGFSFNEQDLERYRQVLEQRRIHNRQINRSSAKLQFIWLIIFAVVIGVAGWWVNS